MEWGIAFKTALKMALMFIATALVGIILIGIGFAMTAAGTADSVFEEGNSGLIFFGFIVMLGGYVWVYIAGIAVFIKYFAESVDSLVSPTVRDIQNRIIYLQQNLSSASRSSSTTIRNPPEPDDPWGQEPPRNS